MSKKSMKKKKLKLSEKVRQRKKKIGSDAAAQEQNKSVNPFELKFNKQKHSLVGRNSNQVKTATVVRVGKPGFSKKRALERRKDTLLGELQEFGKSNRLLDRRIEERNTGLSKEQKAARRFTLERQKLFKKRGIYRLEEEDADLDRLTHQGQNLADIELTDKPVTQEDEEELDAMDAEFVSRAHFGGGEEDGEKKSRKDLISDLISQSKKLRHEKQTVKSKQENLTDELDEKWKELMEENLVGKLMASAKDSGEPQLSRSSCDDYDTVYNTLRFDRHSVKATDRLETPEELAKKEKARLEDLEKKRMERVKLVSQYFLPHVSADDDLSGNVQVVNASADSSVSRKERTDEEVSDLSDLSILEISDVEDGDDTEEVEGSKRELSEEELPYVFEFPNSYPDFVSLLRGHSDRNQSIILERLIKCHHPSLKEGNKQKLRKLFVLLLRYFDSEFAVIGNLEFVDGATKALYALTQHFPDYSGECVKKLLHRHRGRAREDKHSFPGLASFLLLRLIPHLFSVSDFQHPVATPALFYACEILKNVRIREPVDVAKGLVLCAILIEYVAQSKRYIPELVAFLHGVLYLCVEHEDDGRPPTKSFPLSFPHDRMLLITEKSCETTAKIDLKAVFGSKNHETEDGMKCSCIFTCLALLRSLALIYSSLPSFREVFVPVMESVKLLPSSSFPEDLCAATEKTVSEVQHILSHHRKVGIRVEEVKVKEFKFLEPRMEQGFNPERSKRTVGPKKGPKAERKRLMHQVRKETRGAVRELRRDSQFLAREKLRQTQEKDLERKKKTKDIMKSLKGQESEHSQTRAKKKKN